MIKISGDKWGELSGDAIDVDARRVFQDRASSR